MRNCYRQDHAQRNFLYLKIKRHCGCAASEHGFYQCTAGWLFKVYQSIAGMHVRKGDVIAVMEDQQYIQLQQDYLTAKAKIGFAERI